MGQATDLTPRQMSSKFQQFPKLLLFTLFGFFSALCVASDGELNKVDDQGQRQGYWVVKGEMLSDKAYKPQDKVEEGNYKDNRKEGLWKKYWPGGKLRNEINYQSGKPEGEYKLYFENGQLEEHGIWKGNKNTGEFKRYYTNGNPQQHFAFAENGKRNGTQKYYHENGKMALEVSIVNGAESGVSKRYNPDGTLAEEKIFENGVLKQGSTKKHKEIKKEAIAKADPYDKKIGKSSVVTEDKTNKAVIFKPNGFNTLYDKNGNVTQSGEFVEGRLYDGKWYRYNADGLMIRIEIYKGGKYIGTGVISDEEQK